MKHSPILSLVLTLSLLPSLSYAYGLDICKRHPAMKAAITGSLMKDCHWIGPKDLAKITELEVRNVKFSTEGVSTNLPIVGLKPEDFSGLENLEKLSIVGVQNAKPYSQLELPLGLLAKLPKLTSFDIYNIEIDTLDLALFNNTPIEAVGLQGRIKKIINSGTVNNHVNDLSIGAEDFAPSLSGKIFEGFSQVEEINLAGIVLEDYALQGLSKVTQLTINAVDFSEHAFSGLDKITRIDLTSEGAKTLYTNMFKGDISLESLYLYLSGLKSIEADTFADAPALRVMNLRASHVEEVSENAFRGSHISSLVLENIKTLKKNTLLPLEALFLVSVRADTFELGSLNGPSIKYAYFSSSQSLPIGIFNGVQSENLFLKDRTPLLTGVFDGIRGLHLLRIDNNQSDEFAPGLFAPLTELHEIYVDEGDAIYTDTGLKAYIWRCGGCCCNEGYRIGDRPVHPEHPYSK